MSTQTAPIYNGTVIGEAAPERDDLWFRARVYTLAIIAFWALACIGCAHIDGRRAAIATEQWGASVILDETGQPVSIYVEGPADSATPSHLGWILEPGRTADGRPYILLERRPQ